MSATMTIAVCVMLTLLVFAIDAFSIRRERRAILQVPLQDSLQDPLQDPLDPDVQ
jgi:hypothetical protein